MRTLGFLFSPSSGWPACFAASVVHAASTIAYVI
jgi:hypothetical protein